MGIRFDLGFGYFYFELNFCCWFFGISDLEFRISTSTPLRFYQGHLHQDECS